MGKTLKDYRIVENFRGVLIFVVDEAVAKFSSHEN